jgi:hypothetical protein
VVIVVAVMVTVMVTIPVAIFAPAAFVSIPPSVIPVPAAFALFVQFMAAALCLPAAFTVVADRFIKLGLGPFNPLAALIPVVRACLGSRREQKYRAQERRRKGCRCELCPVA